MDRRFARYLFVAAFSLALSGCRAKTYRDVPDEVVGVWKTSVSKYADRYFELKKDAIVFGTGGDKVKVYSVTKAKVLDDKNEKLYILYYQGTDGEKGEWAFYFESDRGVLRLRSQKFIEWKRG